MFTDLRSLLIGTLPVGAGAVPAAARCFVDSTRKPQ
jgi:hypothetical protein